MTDDTHSHLTRHLRGFTTAAQFDTQKQPPMASFSLHQTTTYHWSLEEDVTACRDFGIGALGVWMRKLEQFGTERAIDFLNESGLRISSLSWAGGFTGVNGMSWEEAVEDTCDAIRIAGKINAGCLLIAAGGRGNHIWNHANKLLIQALKRVSDVADENNVTLALQPMHADHLADWSFLSTIDAAMDVIRCCRHPRIQLAFDAWQLWQEADLQQRIAEIASHVAIVQLSDGPAKPVSANDRCLPGDGDVPLREITQAFVKRGYRGFFEMALWSDEIWQREYHELIHDCRRRFDSVCRA